MKKYWLIITLLPLLSCSTESSKTEHADSTKTDTSTVSSNTSKPTVTYRTVTIDPSTSSVIQKLESTFDKVPFFAICGNMDYLFYVQKGKKESDDIFNGSNRYGLVDSSGNEILPLEYTKIYNPDGTVLGFIEIESNGKKGLFSYLDKKILTPKFDIIFPSDKSEFIAIGKNENEHYGITSDLKEKKLSNFTYYETNSRNLSFDIKTLPLIYSGTGSSAGEPDEGNGVIITPSYIQELGFPEIIQNIFTNNTGEFGVESAKGEISETMSVSDQMFAMISDFYEEGIEARDYQTNISKLIIVDKNNNVLNKKQILEGISNYHNYCGEDQGYRFVNNSVLEVRVRINSQETYNKYDDITGFIYYSIAEQGEIEQLESPRLFDVTKFTLLTDNHLKGCYTKYVESEDGNLQVSEHLDIEDLDLMRNEIYAEYGLIFKSEKWNTYFRKQAWYTPKYDNVDQYLTETDKKNVDFILKTKEKMKGNEDSFTNKRVVGFAVAG